MKLPLLAALLTALPTLAQTPKPAENLVQYVHPSVGTQRMGHTFPGATVPFGMATPALPISSASAAKQARNQAT
ncbi:putative alpha-1,2-mannosidase [Hymenobacter luteus]|uniref:Alpha-1,2-mannosidase n=2 Tax=Hymenobacter TaxID=89966 RepID=A0ABR6JVS4_9BACT|nr:MULTISPECIES: hypothetical protein [Hymenobacter]MBB4600851.1 putative alpha-1,2-mannosidase [Hymenobacter latericoloratus]MBB6058942.1 putative alpha-1,2-mannosidase [Hymenobacter luteus]